MTTSEFNALVEDAADALYRYALGIVRREDEAQDIVQDAFEGLWKNRQKIDLTKSRSYLFSTAHNRCIDRLRRRKPVEEVQSHHVVTHEAPSHDVSEWLRMGLATLPPDQQSVLLLRDYEGYSYAEIAELTGLTADQVKVYIFRGRKALRTYIGHLETLI